MEMTDTKQERSGGGIGLTFAGGGGKGAYQIGVWKYLREIGMEKVIAVYLKTSPDMSANSRYREDTVEIIPSESIGNFFTGTLNFTKEHALELMEFGYLDAKERYEDQLRALLQCDSHLDPEIAAREEERMRSENG